MTKEISKQLVCVQIRSGIEIWVEQDKAKKLQAILQEITGSKFIEFDNRTINTADVVGVFLAVDLDELRRRKQGQWKCTMGNKWHDRDQRCGCIDPASNKRAEAVKNCKKCTSGFVEVSGGGAMTRCECVKDLC